eukprot:1058200-Prymnesium_polylepis.1
MPKRKGVSHRATGARWKRETPVDADHPGDDAEANDAQVAHVSNGETALRQPRVPFCRLVTSVSLRASDSG